MNYAFDAHHAFVQEEEGYLMIGLSDSQDHPRNYVLLQQASEYDEQDLELGMGGIYLEIDDQSQSVYSGIEEIVIMRDSIRFVLNEKGKNKLKLDGEIAVTINHKTCNYEELINAFRLMAEKDKIPLNSIN
ncbi:Imm10 family immunity protein [Chitinivorax sp. B]|uniref:Imm10 family immunity protein n=1 Tax=Chitinivorax sp. B TaxID=2502235 RepID=UPI0010F5E47A|nr:Imm10 family immunity protein [Chitinivorax sp. B]